MVETDTNIAEVETTSTVVEINELIDELAKGSQGHNEQLQEKQELINELQYQLSEIKDRLIELVLGKDEDNEANGEDSTENNQEDAQGVEFS